MYVNMDKSIDLNTTAIITIKNIFCDIIWENPAYGGTKRSGSDQTPRILRGV